MTRLFAAAAAATALLAGLAVAQEGEASDPPARNVIIFIGDGMGLAHVTATAYTEHGMGEDAAGLFFENFPVSGYVTTFSADSLVTDSAAAATAMACGVKTNNGMLGVTPDGTSVESILEIADARGLATGLVTSVPIGHATPAGFRAHVGGRGSVDEIVRQYFANPNVDVFLGGGLEVREQTSEEVFASAEAVGYTALRPGEADRLARVAPGDRVFGAFDENGNDRLDFTSERASVETTEPRLVDMAQAAITALSANEKGFFLMVESGAIDWAAHANEARNVIDETLEFEATIETICGQLEELGVLDETLILVTADHETGGLSITGPYRATIAEGATPELTFTSDNHTAIPVGIWGRGPGAAAVRGRIDDTDIFRAMLAALPEE